MKTKSREHLGKIKFKLATINYLLQCVFGEKPNGATYLAPNPESEDSSVDLLTAAYAIYHEVIHHKIQTDRKNEAKYEHDQWFDVGFTDGMRLHVSLKSI